MRGQSLPNPDQVPPSTPSGLDRLLLGANQHQRLRASQCLLALALNSLFAMIQHLEALCGLIPMGASNLLTLFNVGASVLFFATIRSGLNMRLAPAEPSLTLPQCATAVTALAWSYAITGPARGALLALLILLIQFGGLFRLDLRQVRGLTLYAFLLIASVMAWRTGFAEQRYDPTLELVHFALTSIVLFGANVLATRYGSLRERLSRQKADLEAALELNRELATRDMLTGLLNRRAMVEMLARPAFAQRGDQEMALALVDIDFFKRINDVCGHNVGDGVLRRFADRLRQAGRTGDLVARWGGEEFLVLLPGTDPATGRQALELLREQVIATDWADLVGELPVSFSAGVTGLTPGEDYEAAIERADQALYRAKHLGRNRIESA